MEYIFARHLTHVKFIYNTSIHINVKIPLAACTFHFILFMAKQSFHGFFILYNLLLDLGSSTLVSGFDSEIFY